MSGINFTKAKKEKETNEVNMEQIISTNESTENLNANDFISLLDNLVKTDKEVNMPRRKKGVSQASAKKETKIDDMEKYLQDLRRKIYSDMRKLIVDINVSNVIVNDNPRKKICDIVIPQANFDLNITQESFELSLATTNSPVIIDKPKIKIIFRNQYTYIERAELGFIVITNQNIKLNENIISFYKEKDILSMVVKNLVQLTVRDKTIDFDCLDGADLTDNDTLLISQEEGKVYLPYKIEAIRREAKAERMTVEQLINEKYIVSMEKYKYSISARYKEAFKLARERENKSVQRAVLLGIELMFDFSLHPAIISACKTIDELDLYLDCLEGKKLDKFSCFKIAYKALPMLAKSGKHIMQGT